MWIITQKKKLKCHTEQIKYQNMLIFLLNYFKVVKYTHMCNMIN